MRIVIDYMNKGIKHFLNVILAVLILAVFMQVLFRFVLNQPLAWTEELARYCLVWLTFLGAAYAMSRKAHIGVEIITNSLPTLLRKSVYIIGALVSIGFFFVMIQQGFNLTSRSMTQLSPVLRVPMGWIYAIIPLSGLIFMINLLFVSVEEMKKGEKT